MGIFGRTKEKLKRVELETLHLLLSKLYDGSKFKQTELNDALFLRMRVNTVLKDTD
jgi:hypothetical protein